MKTFVRIANSRGGGCATLAALELLGKTGTYLTHKSLELQPAVPFSPRDSYINDGPMAERPKTQSLHTGRQSQTCTHGD